MPDVKPGDSAFISRAWAAWGGMFSRPDIKYVEGDALNCDTGPTYGRGFLVVPGTGGSTPTFVEPGTEGAECWLGFTIPAEFSAVVAWQGSMTGTTKKAIVHELCHYVQSDFGHDGVCKPEGGRIDEITAQLN